MSSVIIRAGGAVTQADRRRGAKVVRVVTGRGDRIDLSPLEEVSLLRPARRTPAIVTLLRTVKARVKNADLDDPLDVVEIPERGSKTQHVLGAGESMWFDGAGTVLKVDL